MNLVNSVYEIAEQFMEHPEWVEIKYDNIETVANEMLQSGPPVFTLPKVENVFVGIVLDLVASSVNYCYWYGKSTVRPNGASSTLMYYLLINSFYDFEKSNKQHFFECIDRFIKQLVIYRFPLLEERIKHLNELQFYSMRFCEDIETRYHCGIGLLEFPELLSNLVSNFPGFASDIFLKRASLFFIQLHRRFGWFKDELKMLHVPADYQIPKMLSHFNCIAYHPVLQIMIDADDLIPKNSKIECEIRSATILTIRKLCELTDWNVAEVDDFFFAKRNDSDEKFHLCITTDY